MEIEQFNSGNQYSDQLENPQQDASGKPTSTQGKRDLWRKYTPTRINNPDGTYTETVRTPFGEHVDHMNEFYAGLNADQKAAFVSPIGPNWRLDNDPQYGVPDILKQKVEMENGLHQRDVQAFEKTLTPAQLVQWNALKTEAQEGLKKFDGTYVPEEARPGLDDRRITNAKTTEETLGFHIAGIGEHGPTLQHSGNPKTQMVTFEGGRVVELPVISREELEKKFANIRILEILLRKSAGNYNTHSKTMQITLFNNYVKLGLCRLSPQNPCPTIEAHVRKFRRKTPSVSLNNFSADSRPRLLAQ